MDSPTERTAVSMTEGDFARMFLARAEFLNCLLADERTQELFRTTWESLLSNRVLVPSGQAMSTGPVNVRFGFVCWETAIQDMGDPPKDARLDWDEQTRLVWDVTAECIKPQIRRFIRSLGLLFPWLFAGLQLAFLNTYLDLGRRRRPDGVAQTYFTRPPMDVPAPSLSLTFETRAGETAGEAMQRLNAEAGAVMKLLKEARNQASLPRGRYPEVDEDATTVRYVRWFYRHRHCGHSINSIAKTEYCDRKTVRRGIERAFYFLSLQEEVNDPQPVESPSLRQRVEEHLRAQEQANKAHLGT